MTKESILSFDRWSDLPATDQELIACAKEAQALAYAPYSGFRVGAAVRTEDGSMYRGFNIENAAYPMCLCAERTAMAHCLAANPKARIIGLAVIGGEAVEPAFPCGACRQVIAEMMERQGIPFFVLAASLHGRVYKHLHLEELLPHSFKGSDLL